MIAIALTLALNPGWSFDAGAERLEQRVVPPPHFSRVEHAPKTFAAFLRRLPLKPKGTDVVSHRGEKLWAPALAVVDVDIGKRDLQQCADSVIRLHAEWLWSQKRENEIVYKFTSGDAWAWKKRKKGHRVKVLTGRGVSFPQTAKPGGGRKAFRRYLNEIFMFAGTASLARDAQKVPSLQAARTGDFFVYGGAPGHAVQILDEARDDDGRRAVLLGQGFMPAQSFHVIEGPFHGWFLLSDPLATPSWPTPFAASTLRRLRPSR